MRYLPGGVGKVALKESCPGREIAPMPDGITILCGDAVEQLRTLPDRSVHMCVTSPPFVEMAWRRLRDPGALVRAQEQAGGHVQTMIGGDDA